MATKKAAAKKVRTKVTLKNTAAKRAVAKAAQPRKPIAKRAERRTAAVVRPAESGHATSATSASERIDRRIASLGDWRGERLAEIRKLIHDVDPAVVEEWKWMGTPVWSNRGMYALANAHKDKVKLTFFHGAQLADPNKLFNAGLAGGKWRAIDFRAGDRIDKAALKALLREAVSYNTTHTVAKSKGSRA